MNKVTRLKSQVSLTESQVDTKEREVVAKEYVEELTEKYLKEEEEPKREKQEYFKENFGFGKKKETDTREMGKIEEIREEDEEEEESRHSRASQKSGKKRAIKLRPAVEKKPYKTVKLKPDKRRKLVEFLKTEDRDLLDDKGHRRDSLPYQENEPVEVERPQSIQKYDIENGVSESFEDLVRAKRSKEF